MIVVNETKCNEFVAFLIAHNYRYDAGFNLKNLSDIDSQSVHIPLVVDSEFYHHSSKYLALKECPDVQSTLTVQIKGIRESEGTIYTHQDSREIARHPIFESDFIGIDYLKNKGFSIDIKDYGCKIVGVISFIQFDLFGFFLNAELYRIFQGKLLQVIDKIVLGRIKNLAIKHGRRLTATSLSKVTDYEEQFITIPNWYVTLNNQLYQLRFSLYDLCAIVGTVGYDKFCKLAGHTLKHKDTLSIEDKSDMQRIYMELTKTFDNYALGDLDGYEALIKLEQKFSHVYDDLGLSDYWEDGNSLRLTIGASVNRLTEAALLHHLKLPKSEQSLKLLRELTQYGNSKEIKKDTVKTSCFLAKVDGGRCRNNRPTDISVEGVIVDIDIAGCYGNGLKNQTYPIGRPVTFGYPIDSDINEFLSLRKFLKLYGNDLVPGLWMARVSSKELLKYGQDFLVSWLPPRNLDNIPTDSDIDDTAWWTEENIGLTKIFTNQVLNGVITHDFIQWLDNVCTSAQRKELLDNLYVVCAVYYHKLGQVNSLEELLEKRKQHKGRNTCTVKNINSKITIINIEQERYYWYGVNLGELIVDELLLKRGQYNKKDPEQQPFNELYKLIINTIYGDQVSPYFNIGNVVVGNNITARARALAWYMEKGLDTYQTITDGGAFNLNEVVYPDRAKITSQTVFQGYTKGCDLGNFKKKPLFDKSVEILQWETEESTGIKKAILSDDITLEDIGSKAWEHLRNLFPCVDILHKLTTTLSGETKNGQFTLEVKTVASKAAFHGTANYIFLLGDEYSKPKMRSYNSKPKKVLRLNHLTGDLDVISEIGKPSEHFLKQLITNPKEVIRGDIFIQTSILKPSAYKRLYTSRYESSKIFPGCTIEQPRLLREFSLTQFTYQSLEQYETWERSWRRLFKDHGQSFEMFFLNRDGSVNMVKMVKTIDTAIRTGQKPPKPGKGIGSNPPVIKAAIDHPAFKGLNQTKAVLGNNQGWHILDRFDIDMNCDADTMGDHDLDE